jgi:hypothetical protein
LDYTKSILALNRKIQYQTGEIVQLGMKKAVSKNTINGEVIPNKWNDSGNITGIAIRTHSGGLYLVAHNRMESELLNQLHNQVGIQGKITERLDGAKLIHVRSFKPILSNSDDSQEKQPCQSLKEE